MKVLAINGSARRNGNTAILLEAALAPLREAGIETETVALAGKRIGPCRACWGCAGRRNCVQPDDFQAIFEKMTAADGLLFASPVYLANLSSSMQALLERAAVAADGNPGLFRRKAGASLAVAHRAGALHAVDAMNHFFLNRDCVIAGSTYWTVAYGTAADEVRQDGEGLRTARRAGENLAWLLRLMEKEA